MAYEQRDMSGSLFRNDKKESEKHPNMTGSAMIDGVEYYVSGWTKESAKGKWVSLAFKQKDKEAPKTATRASVDELDNDLPF